MRFLAQTVTASMLLAGVGFAQSFNIDMGTDTPVPTVTFGGAAGQSGTWNVKNPATGATPTALVDVSGAATSVSLSRTSGTGTNFSWDHTGTFGDDEALMDDGEFPSSTTGSTWTISGLAAGTYSVYTYAWAPDDATLVTNVTVNGGPTTAVGGAWSGAYTLGVTHALDSVTVGASGSIVIFLVKAPVPATNFATFNGIQIVGGGATTSSFCDGSAVGTTCLGCGNNGAPGNGCANSGFAVGGHLAASGVAGVSSGTDTLVLTATNITGPGLFFQGSGLAASPLPFGDGELCASVGITRLGVVFPAAGSASYPGGLTPQPIHAGGGPLVAGDIRHYQCWYRDALTFCTTATFNLTQGITLTWVP